MAPTFTSGAPAAHTSTSSLCDWLRNQGKVASSLSEGGVGTTSWGNGNITKMLSPLAKNMLVYLYQGAEDNIGGNPSDGSNESANTPSEVTSSAPHHSNSNRHHMGSNSGHSSNNRSAGSPGKDFYSCASNNDNNKNGCVLPRIIRDIEFVSFTAAAAPPIRHKHRNEGESPCVGHAHAVLDTLLAASKASSKNFATPLREPAARLSPEAVSRSLLVYLARVDTVHPITVCRSILWAGENKGLLLALSAVLSSKTELQGDGGARGGGPSRLPGWDKIALAEYRLACGGAQRGGSGEGQNEGWRSIHTSPRQGKGMMKIHLHAAALAEACVAALAVGAHSSLLILLQVLDVAITALYTRERLVVPGGDATVTEEGEEEKMTKEGGRKTSSKANELQAVGSSDANHSHNEEEEEEEEGTALGAFHASEARLVSALQILMNYSASISFVGSALGNLTAHLPTVIVPEHLLPLSAKPRPAASTLSTPGTQEEEGYCVISDPSLISLVMDRKKEATLHPGVSRPIKISHDVDITPLLGDGARSAVVNRRTQ